MTTDQTAEPTPDTPTRRDWGDRLKIYWPNVVTLAVALAVVLTTYHYTEQRREYVECHTEAMDTLHHALYATLSASPDDPATWGPKWVAAFALWQREMDSCPSIDELPGDLP